MHATTGLKVTTPSDLQIVMTRQFNARRELVWDAMTKPELLRRWMFAPPGWTMTECRMDVRVDGEFRWAWNDDMGRETLAIYGVYKEIAPPSRIVHTERMVMGRGLGCPGGEACDAEVMATLELTEQGKGTLMRMTLDYPSKQVRDMALQSGMEHGMEAGYQALDRHFAAGGGV